MAKSLLGPRKKEAHVKADVYTTRDICTLKMKSNILSYAEGFHQGNNDSMTVYVIGIYIMGQNLYGTVFGQMSHKARPHAKRWYSLHVYPIKRHSWHGKVLLHPHPFKNIDQTAYRKQNNIPIVSGTEKQTN